MFVCIQAGSAYQEKYIKSKGTCVVLAKNPNSNAGLVGIRIVVYVRNMYTSSACLDYRFNIYFGIYNEY